MAETSSPQIPFGGHSVSWDEVEGCFFVECRVKRADHVRCLLKSLCVNPYQVPWLFLMAPGIMYWLSMIGVPFWNLIAASMTSSAVLSTISLAEQSSRVACRSKITQDGLEETVSKKTTVYLWSEIKKMRSWNDDLFFFCAPLKSCAINSEAFSSPAEARFFFEIAERMWKSQGADWPQIGRQFRPRSQD